MARGRGRRATRNWRAHAAQLLYRLADHGKAEWWAYGWLLAWLIVVPAGVWSVGQASAAAASQQASIVAAQSVPEIKKVPLTKAELGEVASVLHASFPDFRLEVADRGVLKVTAKGAEMYHDWLMAMNYLAMARKATVWSVNELCLNSEAPKCGAGGAIYVELKGESIVLSGGK